MKTSFISILSIMLIFCLSFSTFANNTQEFIYTYDNLTVIFNEDTCFNSAQRQTIANALIGEENSADPTSILCIFGHDWLEDTIVTITHCVSETQPRCLRETFDIYMCSRCEKTKTELFARTYVYCCD